MKIVDVIAYPVSFRLPEEGGVTLGIGRAVKRDAVIVKVTTESGLVGFGESHHGRAPGAIAHLVNTTLRDLVLGMDATDTISVWSKVYRMQLASHGMGAAAVMALSGIDLALWDIRGKAVGWPLYRLLGGSRRPIAAYAGGISLGFQEPDALVEEASGLVAEGYRALKLRFGDSPKRDIERLEAVRRALGDDIDILVDANAAYSRDDARKVMPVLDALEVGWLEEPFSPHDYDDYAAAARFGSTPLAAGENHYTRFEFTRVLDDGAITIFQPDVTKTGGMTEAMRVAAMASAWKRKICPHTSQTGISMAASLHFLSAIENGGYYEADVSKVNEFRDRLCSPVLEPAGDGCFLAPDAPGIGVEVDEDFIRAHPVIEGACYV